jgi:hypothetical protein
MTLSEYYVHFYERTIGRDGPGFTMQVAAEVAAAHEIGLTFDQLQAFLARRTQITSVACALKGPVLKVEAIERIIAARGAGAVHPKDVLLSAFSPEEIHEKFETELQREGTQ